MNTDKINEVKDEERAIAFFAEYFKCSQSEAKDCHAMTIDCMIKFLYAQRQSADSVSKGEEWISVKDRMPVDGQIVDIWEMPCTQHQNNIRGLENSTLTHKCEFTGWRSTNYVFKKEKDEEGYYHCFTKVYEKTLLEKEYPKYKKLVVENGEVSYWKTISNHPNSLSPPQTESKPVGKEVGEVSTCCCHTNLVCPIHNENIKSQS